MLVKYPVILFLMALAGVALAGQGEFEQFRNGPGDTKRATDYRIDDRQFLRRVWLDLTGTLPTETQVNLFLANRHPQKRAQLVDSIMETEAFVNRWTTFFEDLFWSRALLPNARYRNPFHQHVLDMVSQNTPWDQMARTMLEFKGGGIEEDSSFLFWVTEAFEQEFRLDFLDDQIGLITESMLGLKVECISCHDGQYHLEDVNKGLSVMTRDQFWGMAAFLSQTYIYLPPGVGGDDEDQLFDSLQLVELDDPDFSVGFGYLVLAEEPFHNGEYLAQSEAGDGMRSPRNGGVIAPKYLTTGEAPRANETRRQALARMITADRQFARNMVNRLWAHFFGEGFVEPLDEWDLGRLNPTVAAQFETTAQPRNHLLMESLTDWFIDSGYDLREMMRLVCNSYLYQYDFAGAPPATETDGLWYWRGEKRIRRVEAETIVDSVFQILEVPRRYTVTGILDRTIDSTWALPDTAEPNVGAIFDEDSDQPIVSPESLGYESLDHYFFFQYTTMDLLNIFGWGDRTLQKPREKETSLQMSLSMMNQWPLHLFTLEAQVPMIFRLTQALEAEQLTPDTLIDHLFRRILFRDPTAAEKTLFLEYAQADRDEEETVRDLVWTLFNHPDFLFK